ncbi:hypothetical protein B0H15DRAFT_880398 [Mycena belliarum]|uniref:GSKIP domain-containing protein n=1 Tax=Mycena belliarum TaxID=1033014 RepID=A0AAD6UEM8_9AGAR|nr:hypothetical protein B0H15DRAFT_880398 [Mycena belliae]
MSTFCADELQHALAEESSTAAIGPFHLIASAPLGATAAVTLLEGRTIRIALTTNGYSIVADDNDSDTDAGRYTATAPTFESIDQLLRSVSSMYEERRQQALIAALESVSDRPHMY